MSKATSYSAELVTAIVAQYQEGIAIETIAKDAGKTVPMIRSKLVSEGVYVAKAKTSKATGKAPVRKLALAQKIAAAVDVESLDSFEKASKSDLETLLTALTELLGEE